MYVIQYSEKQTKLLKIQALDVYCVPCVYFFLTSGTRLEIKQGITRVEERIVDPEYSRVILTPLLLVTKGFITALQ